jgi:hypothetical protein
VGMEDSDRWVLGVVVKFHPDLTTVYGWITTELSLDCTRSRRGGSGPLQRGLGARETKCEPTRAVLRSDDTDARREARRCFGRSDRSAQRSGPCHSLMKSMGGPRRQPPNCRHPLATAGQAGDIAAGLPESRPGGRCKPRGLSSSEAGPAALLPWRSPPRKWTGGCRHRRLKDVCLLSSSGDAG